MIGIRVNVWEKVLVVAKVVQILAKRNKQRSLKVEMKKKKDIYDDPYSKSLAWYHYYSTDFS